MIPIITVEQIREADAYTIKHEPVSSIDLMERASLACANWICSHFDINTIFSVLCGQGNNGGDGLAISRLLLERGYDVEPIILKFRQHGSDDFEANLKRLKSISSKIRFLEQPPATDFFATKNIIIDAMFGTGLNKIVNGFPAAVIHMLNKSKASIISIDIPSGLFAEGSNTHASEKNTIRATHTLTFQLPKLSFLLPDSGAFVGNFSLLDIGLDLQFINQQKTSSFLLIEDDIPFGLLHRKKFSHKGNYGHALILSGSKGKTGAAVLAAEACLRSGAGLLTVHVPGDSLSVIQTAVPEAMASIDPDKNVITQLPDLCGFSAIGIGSGIGTSNKTASVLKLLIQNTPFPIIIDADALNILAENKTWLSFLPALSILTPHPGEFERLFGKTESHFERLQLQKAMSVKYNIIIILKGAHTSVSFPDGKVFFNSTGNPGMATAGSGDVLTGVITGLFAQTKSPTFAALAGVFVHGTAGDIVSDELGEHGMLAGDIIQNIPITLKKFV